MKRYMPTFTQTADSAEQWAGMTEDRDGDWYSRGEADDRIEQLERALKSCSHVLKQQIAHTEKHYVLLQEALLEADKALALMAG